MRLVALGVVWAACLPGIAQDQAQLYRWVCLADKKCQQSNDARPEKQAFARTAKVDQWWPEERAQIMATFMAKRIDSEGDVFRLKGNAEITTGVVIVRADEADYHWDTGEIDARGNVHVKPIPYRPSPGLSQFGIK
jgi:lipopolysaccharide assembly outer membrane protein LptD (OstA)